MNMLIGVSSILVALSNASGWGYSKDLDNNPIIGKYQNIIEEHNVYYRGDDQEKEIYLTFDTGYDNGNINEILNILKRTNVSAIFFVTGHFVKQHPDLVKRMVEEGHVVGNHTYSHPDLAELSKEKINQELIKLENEYKKVTGLEMYKFIRPPKGTFSPNSLQYLDELGYVTIFWSLAYVDWLTDSQRGYEYAYDSVMNNIHNGAVILMHTVSDDNVEGLEKIIVDLKQNKYQFKEIFSLIAK